LLTETEPGRRNRRTIDAALLAWAAVVIGLTAVVASSAPESDVAVADALKTVLGWADTLWRVAFVALLAGAIAIVADVVVERRWSLARDLVVAVLVVFAAGVVLGGIVESDWFPIKDHLLSRWGYPELRLAVATAIIVVAAPELLRAVRAVATCLIPLATVGAVVLGAALPASALGALAVGLGAGALVRLVFGSGAGVPPTATVRAALEALGVAVADLRPAAQQHVGAAVYVGHDGDAQPLKVRVLGKDAPDTQRLARRWRLLAYRDPPRSAPVGRLEQVEHEAVATLMAAQAGVSVPDVVMAAAGPDGDALMVTRQPDGAPLESASADAVSDATLADVWRQAGRLHAAGIAHGRLNLSNVQLDTDGLMLVDLSAATLGAPQAELDMDVAELLVASAVLVGPERALRLAVDGGWSDAIARALPYLQRAALTPHLRDLARESEVGLKELRVAAAEATGQKVPEVVPLRRVRLRDLVVMAMVVFAAYLVITQLAKIGFDTIADELRHADVAWIVLALIVAQTTFVAQGISLRGTVATPLPLLPAVVLQSAIKFINMTVPSSAGRIGINIRFLQQMGVPTPQAVAAGAVDDASETIVQIAVVLITLPFVDFAIDRSQLKFSVPSGRLITTVVVLLAVVVVAMLASSSLRAKVMPPIRNALSGMWAVARDRRKRLELFGGNLGSELLYAIALGAVCRAYGIDLSLPTLLLVNAAASAFAGLIPVPGGVGAAEAGLTAGLVAVGVDDSTAFAIAFTHRLCTYYLPPIWGYFSMRWLRGKAYI
jgi:glycosyltransferase 2 family protein